MLKKATEFQRTAMSRMYRGKEIFKPLNTDGLTKTLPVYVNGCNELTTNRTARRIAQRADF